MEMAAMTRVLVLLLALGGAASLQAQQQPLVGAWQISYTAGMVIDNGVQTPIMATGVLTIEAQGDSLIGTLVTEATADLPARPPARLAGKPDTAGVVFISRTRAKLNMNGVEHEETAIGTWKLAAKGDSLAGTVERKIEGFDAGASLPREVTGTRQKS